MTLSLKAGNRAAFAEGANVFIGEQKLKTVRSVSSIMARPFEITGLLDAENAVLRLVATGAMDSESFVDRQIECLCALQTPWAYNRLVDLTDCTGACAYESLHRFAYFWISRQSQLNRTIREAVVTSNRLTIARLPTIELLFPKHELRAFTDVAEAEAWVMASEQEASLVRRENR